MLRKSILLLLLSITPWVFANPADRQVLWGDTHVHTANSFDAFLNGNRSAGPEIAYKYAMGKPVIHPLHRARIQLKTPLDFIVVADHAEYLGVIGEAFNNGLQVEEPFWDKLKSKIVEWRLNTFIDSGYESFVTLLPESEDPIEAAKTLTEQRTAIMNSEFLSHKTWNNAIKIADQYNQPGEFTTLIGWEWSALAGGANLHRVVFMDGDSKAAATFMPFSTFDSPYPEDLWNWLEKTSKATGSEFIAIPHNSNISKGYMFPETTLRDEPFTADYAKLRAKWESVVETTQYKGDSETHPLLSPEDSFADFETYSFYIQQVPEPYVAHKGDYIRSALKRGLEIESSLQVNPYQFGLIGASDSHSSMANAEEDNFTGKFAQDSTPESKHTRGDRSAVANGWDMSASGLAAVWADNNDRQSIMQAFKRREVYATTGPKIQLQLFAGWEFKNADLDSANFRQIGYDKGVPMGSNLTGGSDHQTSSPSFMAIAVKDPNNANLDRLQMVKGWIDSSGESHEQVYNIAWSEGRSLGANGELPAVGNTVNLETGSYENNIGSATLSAFWQDPNFDSQQNAFYYIRVLQIPTARHSLLDAIALENSQTHKGKKPRNPSTIQERAYSSPIWYNLQ